MVPGSEPHARPAARGVCAAGGGASGGSSGGGGGAAARHARRTRARGGGRRAPGHPWAPRRGARRRPQPGAPVRIPQPETRSGGRGWGRGWWWRQGWWVGALSRLHGGGRRRSGRRSTGSSRIGRPCHGPRATRPGRARDRGAGTSPAAVLSTGGTEPSAGATGDSGADRVSPSALPRPVPRWSPGKGAVRLACVFERGERGDFVCERLRCVRDQKRESMSRGREVPGLRTASSSSHAPKRRGKSVQHSAFPSGPPRQYYLSPRQLSFRGVNGTGALCRV